MICSDVTLILLWGPGVIRTISSLRSKPTEFRERVVVGVGKVFILSLNVAYLNKVRISLYEETNEISDRSSIPTVTCFCVTHGVKSE